MRFSQKCQTISLSILGIFGVSQASFAQFTITPAANPAPPTQGRTVPNNSQSPAFERTAPGSNPAPAVGRSSPNNNQAPAVGRSTPSFNLIPPSVGRPDNPAPIQQSMLQVYDLPREMVGPTAAKLQIQFAKDPTVRINTEPGTGKLMVLALPNVHQEIGNIVASMKREIQVNTGNSGAGNSQVAQRIYKLRNIDWRNIENELQKIVGPRMTVSTLGNGEISQFQMTVDDRAADILQVDRVNNQVVLQGELTNVFAWQQIVAAIDNGKASEDFPTRIVSITPADPKKIEKALRLVGTSRIQDPQDPQNPDDEQVTETQRLGNQDMQDEQATGILPNGLNPAQESGLFGDVQIEFIPELDVVIIRGSKRDVQRVMEVIDQIKKQSTLTQPEIEVIPLAHVDSSAIATILQQLNDQVLAARQGQVSITPLGQPNALLMIGRKESVDAIKELIAKLDLPLDPTSSLRVFKLKFASSTDAETTIKSFFVERQGAAGQAQQGGVQVGGGGATSGPTGLEIRVRVVSDFRTNSLIIQASPRDLMEVAKLIEQIDVESTEAENEIRVFGLKNAIASELQPIIQSAISGTQPATTGQAGQGGQGGQPGGAPGQGQGQGGGANAANNRTSPISSRLSIIKNGKEMESGILSGIIVTSNPAINALVVRAPSKSMALIATLIEQLDQSPSAEAQIKVFQVANGSATALATTLQQLFGITGGAATGGTGIFAGFQNQGAGGAAANQDGSIVPIRISTDVRTNSIIASGSKSNLEVMEVLLLRLDEAGLQNRTNTVIWLRNSVASDVATAITNFYNQQRQIQLQQQLLNQNLNPYEQLEQTVLAIAEPQTNSVIISAAPRYLKQVKEMVDRLDRHPPLIVIEILLAEVTLGDTFEWGTEWGLQDALLFDRGLASAGTLTTPVFALGSAVTNTTTPNPLPNNVAGQGLSTFGLGRSNSSLGYGGLVLSAASDSVGALLRTLQDANRLQILSRPHVMTVDNAEGFVQVGQRVPRIQGITNNGTAGGVTVNAQDVDVGLIMRIQPRTNRDGLILMNVAIERSAIDTASPGVTVGFQDGSPIFSPIINTTRAQTRVSAYDGQTVVFAGLISKSRQSISRRIPILADIPIAGLLFKYDQEIERRTELLVVMTPRIIQSPSEMEFHNDTETSRMSWCLADILNIHGDPTLQAGNGLWGPAASPVIFPDVEPAVQFDSYGHPEINPRPGDSPYFILPGGIQPPSANPSENAPSLYIEDSVKAGGGVSPVEVAPNVQPMGYIVPQQGSFVAPAVTMPVNDPNNGGIPLTPIMLTPQGPAFPQ